MAKFEIYRGEDSSPDECWRWRLTNDIDQIIATGGEPFLKGNVVDSIKKVRGQVNHNTPSLSNEDTVPSSGHYFQCIQSENDQKWYWRLKAANHAIVAIGNEGFETLDEINQSIRDVCEVIIQAPLITWESCEDDPVYEAKVLEGESTNQPLGIKGSNNECSNGR